MTKLIVAPSQNVFNRNYKGSSLYTRNGATVMRRKYTTKPLPQNKVVFTSDLLKTSAINYKNLSPTDSQTFDDYVVLHPEFKSAINVMVKINISSNYSLKTTYTPIRSIDPNSPNPVFPTVNIYSYDSEKNCFEIEWEPAIEAGSKIRLFLLCTYGSPALPSVYLPFFLEESAALGSVNVFFRNLNTYDFINIKAKYVNPYGLESPYGDTEVYAI